MDTVFPFYNGLWFIVLKMLTIKPESNFLQELTQKEAEYVSLSRDTTETDLKQRREITSGSAIHIDQVHYLAKFRIL